jgi:hypothetical protein
MRTFAMASILLTTLVLGTDAASAAPWCTEAVKGGGTNCGFYSSSSAWPAPRATAGSAGRTSSKIPIGPAARCNGAIAAAIKDLSGREPDASSSGRCRGATLRCLPGPRQGQREEGEDFKIVHWAQAQRSKVIVDYLRSSHWHRNRAMHVIRPHQITTPIPTIAARTSTNSKQSMQSPECQTP